MEYAILANPASGPLDPEEKRAALLPAANALDADIFGLDTPDLSVFLETAKTLAGSCRVLVVAGGDGTFAEVINAIDTRRQILAYLPIGSGNALRWGLGYPAALMGIVRRIQLGRIQRCDLIDCDGKRRALMASVGIDTEVLKCRRMRKGSQRRIFFAYFMAVLAATRRYQHDFPVQLQIDGRRFHMDRMLNLMVQKHPYYGYGMKVMPEARLDDRRLHVRGLVPGWFKMGVGAIQAYTVGNRIGKYWSCRQVAIESSRPVTLQTDGDLGWTGQTFTFTVLPEAVNIKF